MIKIKGKTSNSEQYGAIVIIRLSALRWEKDGKTNYGVSVSLSSK